MYSYDMIMFDMDGTLIDSYDFHTKCFQRFLRRFGVHLSLDEVGELIGNTVKTILNGTLPAEIHDEALQYLSDFYNEDVGDLIEEIDLIENVVETIEDIKSRGIPVCLLSNSKKELVYEIMRRKNLEVLFDEIRGADNDSLDKYDRCRSILGRHGVESRDAMYVGDTSHDMVLADKVGMKGCLILNDYSWIHREKMNISDVKADIIVSDIKDIKGLL